MRPPSVGLCLSVPCWLHSRRRTTPRTSRCTRLDRCAGSRAHNAGTEPINLSFPNTGRWCPRSEPISTASPGRAEPEAHRSVCPLRVCGECLQASCAGFLIQAQIVSVVAFHLLFTGSRLVWLRPAGHTCATEGVDVGRRACCPRLGRCLPENDRRTLTTSAAARRLVS